MTRATDNGGEDGPGGVVTGETGFAHAGPVVNDQCGYFVVTHFEVVLVMRTELIMDILICIG